MKSQVKLQIVSALTIAAFASPASATAGEDGRGFVYHDENQNGIRDHGEDGLSGVWVSNGRLVKKTKSSGEWSLPVEGESTTFFVVKPRHWSTPRTKDGVPRFYYQHKPLGSPPLEGEVVAPTGPLPSSIDFGLVPSYESSEFDVVVLGDTQPKNEREVGYLARDIVEQLAGTDAAFGVTLGDIVSDLELFEPVQTTLGILGLPWYGVLGNHDLNFDASTDEHADETYELHYGPPTYAFNYGNVHFVVLDDVEYEGTGDTEDFKGRVSERDLEFLRRDVSTVPSNRLVVLLMHIPLTEVENREDVFEAIEDRSRTLSLSGHAHSIEHAFLGEEHGWTRSDPHHHVVNAAASGSWWSGMHDELGVPHATMNDGSPNGYMLYHFDGSSYSIEFRAARRSAEHQMNVLSPDVIRRGELAEIVVNVFNGSEESEVEVRIDDQDWTRIDRVTNYDPFYGLLHRRQWALTWLPGPSPTPHLWHAELPVDVAAGAYWLEVRETDMFGRVHESRRVLRVVE